MSVVATRGDPDPDPRPPAIRRRWVVAVLAALVLGAGFGLGALYSTSVSVESAPPITQPPPLPTATAGADESAAGAEDAGNQTVAVDSDFGRTEIASMDNFPLVDFDWELVTLPGGNFFELRWFGQVHGEFAAVGLDMPEGDTGRQLVTWKSDDGRQWRKAASLILPENSLVHDVKAGGRCPLCGEAAAYLVAIGEAWNGGSAVDQLIYTSWDGEEWTAVELPGTDDQSGYSYIQDIAINDSGLVLVATNESYPPEPPQRIELNGFVVEIDHQSGFYNVMDETETVVSTGPIGDLWPWQENGQGIWNPDTGELITTVPWEVWDQGWSTAYGGYGSPLPIPYQPSEPEVVPVFEVEWDGLVITVDENESFFAVADADTGAVIASGDAQNLWRGPPPSFYDQTTGELIISVTWEEWDQAAEASWMAQEEVAGGLYRSETFILFSADEVEWERTLISSDSSGTSVAAMATDEEFILIVKSYEEFGGSRSIWRSRDGIQWETIDSSDNRDHYLHSSIGTSDGFLAIADGPGGQEVISSPDGIEWQTEFVVGLQDDGLVWLSAMADGAQGTVVVGTGETALDYEPLTISKGGLTAEFEDEYVVKITDDFTGDVLLALTWSDFDRGSVSDHIVYDTGETRFLGEDGALIMTITDAEAEAASRAREERFMAARHPVMFIELDGAWHEALVDIGGIDFVSSVAVGDSQVLLGGTIWDESYSPESSFRGSGATVVILIGTPVE